MPAQHMLDALSYLRSFLKLVTLGLFTSLVVQELGLGSRMPVPARPLQPSHLHAAGQPRFSAAAREDLPSLHKPL